MIQLLTQVATAYNTLSASLFEPIIADDFVYESQHVFEPMVGKNNFMEYITGKFKTIQKTGATIFAELGCSDSDNINCIILAQGDKEKKVALLFITLNAAGKIQNMEMCTIAPNWRTAKRSNVYPGLA